MTVTFDGHTYTTDENGTISLSKADFTSGEHSVQVEKKIQTVLLPYFVMLTTLQLILQEKTQLM